MVYRPLTSRDVMDEAAEQKFFSSLRSSDPQAVARARSLQWEKTLRTAAAQTVSQGIPEEVFFRGDSAFNDAPRKKSPLRMTPEERMRATDQINAKARHERATIENEPGATENSSQAAA